MVTYPSIATVLKRNPVWRMRNMTRPISRMNRSRMDKADTEKADDQWDQNRPAEDGLESICLWEGELHDKSILTENWTPAHNIISLQARGHYNILRCLLAFKNKYEYSFASKIWDRTIRNTYCRLRPVRYRTGNLTKRTIFPYVALFVYSCTFGIFNCLDRGNNSKCGGRLYFRLLFRSLL